MKIPIVGNELCEEDYIDQAKITFKQLCAGGIKGKDSCGGDSGGPLMKIESLNNQAPRYYLVGIVSFGAKDCAIDDTPAVYTRITHFLDWILDQLDDE